MIWNPEDIHRYRGASNEASKNAHIGVQELNRVNLDLLRHLDMTHAHLVTAREAVEAARAIIPTLDVPDNEEALFIAPEWRRWTDAIKAYDDQFGGES